METVEITYNGIDLYITGQYEEGEPGDYFYPGAPASFRASTIEAFDPNEDTDQIIQDCWSDIEREALEQYQR